MTLNNETPRLDLFCSVVHSVSFVACLYLCSKRAFRVPLNLNETASFVDAVVIHMKMCGVVWLAATITGCLAFMFWRRYNTCSFFLRGIEVKVR
jgi:hypothetical protein